MRTKIIAIVLCAFIANSNQLNAQMICTFAGTGAGGFSGAGGAATAATLHAPTGVATDRAGNVYYCDYERVCKINAAGIISSIAGSGWYGDAGDGGPATAATVNGCIGVAVDLSGNVYIAESGGERIRKIDASGIISTIGGTGVSGYAGDGGQATDARLNSPFAIATDRLGNIYIADSRNCRIRKINAAGIISTIAGTGTAGFTGDGGPATSANLDAPSGVVVDTLGNVYLTANNRIRKVDAAGTITTFAGTDVFGSGGDGGPATLASMVYPYHLAIDKYGNVYVADNDNNNIRKINTLGIISTVAGNGGSGYSGDGGFAVAAELYHPLGVAVDTSGRIYIGDMFNNRVRVVETPSISISTARDTVCVGSSIHFAAAGTNYCDPHYNWQLNGRNIGAYGVEYVSDSLANGDTVTCTLTNSSGDTVLALSSRIIVTVINCSLGLGTPSAGNTKLFPNPVNDELTISSDKKINQVSITNLLGQTVAAGTYGERQVRVDVSGLVRGIYFVTVNGSEKFRFIRQ